MASPEQESRDAELASLYRAFDSDAHATMAPAANGRWGHEKDCRYDFETPLTRRALTLAGNELHFLSHDPSPEECDDYLHHSGRTISDAGRWAIVRFKLAKEEARDRTALAARVVALERATRELFPFAQERAAQFREHAEKLARFLKETGTTPADAVEPMLKLRQAEAEGAEAVLEQARQALKGAGHMPRDPVLKPSTLKERTATARKLHLGSLTDKNPPWGDEELRHDLYLIAITLDWVLRKGKDPVGMVMANEADRRREREKAAKARAEAVDGCRLRRQLDASPSTQRESPGAEGSPRG